MFSQKARYCLKALIALARYRGQDPVMIQSLAASEQIPTKYLATILLQLRDAGYLKSYRGKTGGYTLAMPSKKIMISNVLQLMDGPAGRMKCVNTGKSEPCDDCESLQTCELRSLGQKVRDSISQVLDGLSLDDVLMLKPPQITEEW